MTNRKNKKKKKTTKKRSRLQKPLSLQDFSFSQLMETSEELKKLRKQYQTKSPKERWRAADFHYHEAIASDLFRKSMDIASTKKQLLPGELYALAIDPDYAPARLAAGSYEYIYGRIDEAMHFFLSLVDFPEETEDITIMIDKAGDFLLDNEEIEKALVLYSSASRKHPNNAVYGNGFSYCLGKLGRYDEAIEEARKVVELAPDNHVYLTDLGWTLVEAEHYDEAQKILKQAVALSPAEYELAQGNLDELHRRMNISK